jgi:hypothetical protein
MKLYLFSEIKGLATARMSPTAPINLRQLRFKTLAMF